MKRLADSVKGINTETAKAAKSFKEAGQGARGFADAVRAPGRATKDFASGLRDTIDEIERFTSMVRDIPDTVRGAIDDIKHLTVNMATLGLTIAKTRVPTLKLGAYFAGRFLKGLNSNRKAINALIKATGAYGLALKALTVGAVAFATKAMIDYSRELGKLRDELALTGRFIEVETEVLLGQSMAYERATGDAQGFVKALGQLEDARKRAIAGDETSIDFFEAIGVSEATIALINQTQAWELTKKAIDDGTLSYNQAATVLGRDVVTGLDDVEDALDDITEHEAARAGFVDRVFGPWVDIFDSIGDAADTAAFEIDQMGGELLDLLNPMNGGFLTTESRLEGINEQLGILSTFTEAFRGGSGPGTTTNPLDGFMFADIGVSGREWGLTNGPGPSSYRPPSVNTTSQNSLVNAPETQSAFLRAQQDILDAATGGINLGKRVTNTATTTGGGVGDTRDVLGQRSDRAFARLFEDAQRRAVRDAIDNADFNLSLIHIPSPRDS